MKHFSILFSCLFAMLACISCGDEQTFAPGPETTVKGEGVYFLSDYEPITVFDHETSISDTVWFELGRTDSVAAIDVPIVVESKADCINVPASVHFEAGERTAWMGVTCVGLPYGQECPFVLNIGETYANPYAEKEGSTRLLASILRSQWVEVCDTLIFVADSKPWPDQGCDLERLEGQKRLRFTNFLGSGQTLEFNLKSGWNDKDVTLSKGEINPLTNYYADTSIWYFTNGGNYDAWTPQGSSKTISWVYFYEGSGYTFLDLACDKDTAPVLKWNDKSYYCDYYNHYSLLTAWIVYTDGTSGWEYIYLYPGYLKQ